jgi:hypothetical protein
LNRATILLRGNTTRTKIAEVLEILDDGKWHSIEDIRLATKLSDSQSNAITKFLSVYDFITLDKEKKKVKLKETARKFLTQGATS